MSTERKDELRNTSITLPAEMVDRVDELARTERRTRSAQIQVLLEDALQARADESRR